MLTADPPRRTVAVLSADRSIEVFGTLGAQPACEDCLALLLRAALARHGVVLVNPDPAAGAASAWEPAWTGAAIRQRREAAGLTLADAARLSGLAESTLRNVERRRYRLTAEVLFRLLLVPQQTPNPSTD